MSEESGTRTSAIIRLAAAKEVENLIAYLKVVQESSFYSISTRGSIDKEVRTRLGI